MFCLDCESDLVPRSPRSALKRPGLAHGACTTSDTLKLSPLQGQAESYLERLHKMVENDLNEFIEGAMKVDAWAKWRENLIGLTDVTRSHFDKLVMEL